MSGYDELWCPGLIQSLVCRDKLEVKMAEFSNILQSHQVDNRLDEEWKKLIAVTENLTWT